MSSHYRERSHLRQWWVILILAPAVVVAWVSFVQQILLGVPFGTEPAPDGAVWLVFLGIGVFLPIFMWKAGLVVEVRDGHLHYRWLPFVKRRLHGSDIASVEIRTYRPVRDYGGWGIKYGGGERGWSYTTGGDKGVFITCVDGKCFLLGTEDPEGLSRAIEEIMGTV